MLSTPAAPSASPATFERLYDEFSQPVFSYCARILRSHDDAADATQDTFIKLMRRYDAIPEQNPNRAGYVFTVARHACFDLMRDRRRTVCVDDLDGDRCARENAFSCAPTNDDPEARALASADRALLGSALDQLPERHRRVLVLREVCSLSYEEIATDLGINRNAVAQLISRARAGLERHLRRTGDIRYL